MVSEGTRENEKTDSQSTESHRRYLKIDENSHTFFAALQLVLPTQKQMRGRSSPRILHHRRLLVQGLRVHTRASSASTASSDCVSTAHMACGRMREDRTNQLQCVRGSMIVLYLFCSEGRNGVARKFVFPPAKIGFYRTDLCRWPHNDMPTCLTHTVLGYPGYPAPTVLYMDQGTPYAP